MNNKNTILLIIVIVIAVGAYFLFSSKDASAPAVQETDVTVEPETEVTETEEVEQGDATDPKTEPEVKPSNPVLNVPVKPALVNTDAVIGMNTSSAVAFASANNISFRVVMIDDEPLPVTMDYRPGRINAEVKNGVVVGYTVE